MLERPAPQHAGSRLIPLALAAVALTGCQDAARTQPPSGNPPPQEWSFAAVTSPLDPWAPDSEGQLVLFDASGEPVWTEKFTGIQNAQAVTDGEKVYLTTRDGDVVVIPGSGVEKTDRSSTAGADVVAHGMALNDGGTGLALFNEGFDESPRGYSFMSSVIADGRVGPGTHVDGYVNSIWSCSPGEWAGVVQSMTAAAATQGPAVSVGSFAQDGSFPDETEEVQLAPGTELSPQLELPCAGDAGVLLTVATDPTSEEAQPAVTDISLWHLTTSGAREYALAGWNDKDSHTWLAREAAVVDDTYFWVTPEGSVHSAPVRGGGVTDVVDLQLPQPLSADTVLQFSDDGRLLVSLPSEHGIELQEHAADDDRWTSRDVATLRASVPDGQYVSDILMND